MAEPRITVPSINGNYPDWGKVEIHLNGLHDIEVKALNYNFELKPGEVHGTSAQLLGTTRGKGTRSGSITLFTPAANRLRAALGDAYMTKFWSMTAHWKEASGTVTSLEQTVRITKESWDGTEGEAPLEIKMDLLVKEAKVNNLKAW